jgi:hypothetical protein
MSARNITRTGQASSCYFRTTADGGTRKALVQIDERCNLHFFRTTDSWTTPGLLEAPQPGEDGAHVKPPVFGRDA